MLIVFNGARLGNLLIIWVNARALWEEMSHQDDRVDLHVTWKVKLVCKAANVLENLE